MHRLTSSRCLLRRIMPAFALYLSTPVSAVDWAGIAEREASMFHTGQASWERLSGGEADLIAVSQ